LPEAGGASGPAWLPLLAVHRIHRDQILQHGGRSGIRDEGLLESALARPRNRWEYGDDPDLADLAASYACGIVQDHPFVDGNKRTALMAAYSFLAINGRDLDAPEAETVAVMMALSAGELTEDRFAEWIRRYTRPWQD
jgi:death-on-curing protein